MSRILIVEDEPVIRSALRKLLERHDHEVVEAESVEQALTHPLADFDLLISDLRLPGASGTDLIEAASPAPVLIMTSFASLRSAVDAMKLGAVDYIAKPFDHDEMVAAVSRIVATRQPAGPARASASAGAPRAPCPDEIAALVPGESEAVQILLRQLDRLAATDSPVLITGEPGTGKERVAQAMHGRCARARGPFLSLNCGALPAEQIESELFGHEKGAFVGAHTRHRGLAESASGGILFLDGIDELPLEAQGRLLRLLESGEIRRVGTLEPRQVDVRVVASTSRDLARLVRDGRFRQDLYYRLNVFQLAVPPLRERDGDLELLAGRILETTSSRLGPHGLAFSDDALEAMNAYYWPGNIRELANVIERGVVMAEGSLVTAAALGIDPSSRNDLLDPQEELSLEDYFAHFVLENQDHMTETELARKLGISRKCLWERRQRLGIPRKKGAAVNS